MLKGIGKLVDSTISGAGNFASKGVEKAGLPQVVDFIDETASLVGKASNVGNSMKDKQCKEFIKLFTMRLHIQTIHLGWR